MANKAEHNMNVETPLKIIAGSMDRYLELPGPNGDIFEVTCFVLEGEIRVLTQSGLSEAIGRSKQMASYSQHGMGLPAFLQAQNLLPFITGDVIECAKPIRIARPGGGRPILGYKAKLLLMVCKVYLNARREGVLRATQEHVARHCELLIEGFSETGLIGLIDEKTGYQKIRDKDALAKILDKYVAKNLRGWTKRFPDEFFEELFRVRGWERPEGVSRPSVIGKDINEYVYDLLAPGLRKELEKTNPKTHTGRRRHKHHQWLTADVGHPALKDHLLKMIALMQASNDMEAFKRNVDIFKRNMNRDRGSEQRDSVRTVSERMGHSKNQLLLF